MELLITLLVVLCIFAIVYWVIGQLGLPPPIYKVAMVIMAIIAILLLLDLAPIGGTGFHILGHRP